MYHHLQMTVPLVAGTFGFLLNEESDRVFRDDEENRDEEEIALFKKSMEHRELQHPTTITPAESEMQS